MQRRIIANFFHLFDNMYFTLLLFTFSLSLCANGSFLMDLNQDLTPIDQVPSGLGVMDFSMSKPFMWGEHLNAKEKEIAKERENILKWIENRSRKSNRALAMRISNILKLHKHRQAIMKSLHGTMDQLDEDICPGKC